jgi:hypothetical protein
MTAATRAVGHTSPMNPYDAAPGANRSGSCARCAAVTLGAVRPRGHRRNAARPPARAAFSHWRTAPRVTPSAAALRVPCHPCSCSSTARRRRPSFRSCGGASVVVLMRPVYHTLPVLFSPARSGQ